MIKKLKKRFLLIAMLSVLAVLSLLMGAINVRSYMTVISSADVVLDVLAENDGKFPDRGVGWDKRPEWDKGPDSQGTPPPFPSEDGDSQDGSSQSFQEAESALSESSEYRRHGPCPLVDNYIIFK